MDTKSKGTRAVSVSNALSSLWRIQSQGEKKDKMIGRENPIIWLSDYIPPPPHVQHPMIGTSLWDNRVKQVLERGRQSGARDVIREDPRASNWAECFPGELVLSLIFPLNIPRHLSSFLACFYRIYGIFSGLTNIWSYFYANCFFLKTESALLEFSSAHSWYSSVNCPCWVV